MKAWLKFFRVVNLPTVPGDVLVGAAAISLSGEAASSPLVGMFLPLSAACLASIFLYMYGLADNDIVGAKSDGSERPIPLGEISLAAARIARGLCLLAALIVGSLANLPPMWWIAAFTLVLAIVIYNRTKGPVAMGLCRGLNVLCGGEAVGSFLTSGEDAASPLWVALCAGIWTLYIVAVTKYSEGESEDPAKRQRVGFLIGALGLHTIGAHGEGLAKLRRLRWRLTGEQ